MTKAAINWNQPGISDQVHRLKMLMLTWEFPPNIVGGLSKHVFGLSGELVQIGMEVHVITAGGSGLLDYEVMNNIHVHRVKPLNETNDNFLAWIGGLNLAIAYKAKELGENLAFTIIHAHDWLTGAAAVIVKDMLNCPLLTTIHATESGRNNGIHNEMQQFIHEKESQLIAAADQVIVCSEYMKYELISTFAVPKEKIAIIPNGIDLGSKNNDMPPVISGSQKEKKLIFSIGRIVKEKGFETIIEAASIAKEKKLDLFFVIAGKGPMLENYRQKVRERRLEHNLKFIGYITDAEKNTLMFESDVNVFPSFYEPFGIVALESMIQGKPTIVSNVGGLQGIVQHMQSGLLMTTGNAESLLKQISFVLENPKQAKEIGERGQQVVKNLYGWTRVAEETKRLIEDLILLMRIKDTE